VGKAWLTTRVWQSTKETLCAGFTVAREAYLSSVRVVSVPGSSAPHTPALAAWRAVVTKRVLRRTPRVEEYCEMDIKSTSGEAKHSSAGTELKGAVSDRFRNEGCGSGSAPTGHCRNRSELIHSNINMRARSRTRYYMAQSLQLYCTPITKAVPLLQSLARGQGR